jgi:hypothetical protein
MGISPRPCTEIGLLKLELYNSMNHERHYSSFDFNVKLRLCSEVLLPFGSPEFIGLGFSVMLMLVRPAR